MRNKNMKIETPEQAQELYKNKVAFIVWAFPYIISAIILDIICIVSRVGIMGEVSVKDILIVIFMDVIILYWSRIMYKNRISKMLYGDKMKAHRKERKEKYRAKKNQ